jgi:hypothetical protein
MHLQRLRKTMTPHVDGHGTTMRFLPGSQRMVGGPHLCMYHKIEASPLLLGDWKCGSVYMHVAYEQSRPYVGTDCHAVLNAINEMNMHPLLAAGALLHQEHAYGHPLPGVYTVQSAAHRVDMRVYMHEGMRHLWAEVYRR